MAKHYGQSWPENVDHRGMSRSSPLLTQGQVVHSGGGCNSSHAFDSERAAYAITRSLPL